MLYTSTHLLAAISRRAFIPTGQGTFTDAEILLEADSATQSLILPAITSVREEYYTTYLDYTITAGQSAYAIPPRAIGLRVRDVHVIGDSTTPLPRIELDSADTTREGAPTAVYVRGNSLILDRVPTTTGDTLRVYYELRPGRLIDVDSCAVVSAINGTVVTVTTIPSSWSTGISLDFVSQQDGHEYIAIDNTSTLVSGTDITFASVPSTLAVGDYLCPAGYSCLVQVPAEFQPALVQAVATELLEAAGLPGADLSAKKTSALLKSAIDLITPRIVGEVKTVLPPDWI